MDHYGQEINSLMLHLDSNVKFNQTPLNPEGTATGRNLMYGGNIPSNRTDSQRTS